MFLGRALIFSYLARSVISYSDGERLDLIDDCCEGLCGTIDAPIVINSEGLDKKTEELSSMRVTFGEQNFAGESERPYCFIHAYSLDYAMLNLSYSLGRSENSEELVYIMESFRVLPKQTESNSETADGEELRTLGESRGYEEWGPSVYAGISSNKLGTRQVHLNKFQMQNYRIPPNRLLTIAIRVEALRDKILRRFDASIVADKGTSGRVFFIILGVVGAFFMIGVPGSFLCYKRYFRKKKERRTQHLGQSMHFTRNADVVRYRTNNETADRGVQRDIKQENRAAASASSALPAQFRRLSLSERIWKSSKTKTDPYITPILPKHELLKKQEQLMGARRPIIAVSPVQQKSEFAFPGIDPGHEGDSPPQTVERALQTSRNRVISHRVISEEEVYDDTDTPNTSMAGSWTETLF
ncbi:uncharacterized protein LOC100904673 [Galendromus occidentalis]|uniref:Uncharacterized protein LOC100904673 n=1 Tax=Galendromus occidentalis TaxID=34638 RepID=A0AAJ6QWG2_9ACAR|nr:uncharacterized protein LOC100904673 [Galendromus occidentalis]